MHYRCSVLAVLLVMSAVTADSVSIAQGNLGNPGVAPPNSSPNGATYAEWAARWWQWSLAIPASMNPMLDTTGINCDAGQSGPVWFLAGSPGGTGPVTRTCTIPSGKSLFVALINAENDYPCPDPNFQPAPGQSMEDFLTQGITWLGDQVSTLEVEVDGVSLQNPFSYRATSRLFYFTGDLSLTSFDPCITGTPQPAVTDGYWLMLKPLSAGSHRIHWIADGPFRQEATYILTIAPGKT